MIRRIRTLIAVASPIVALVLMSSAAIAQSYTGNWPMTVTKSQYANGTYCLALTDDGSGGFPHSGEAELVPLNGTYPGAFQVINGILTVTIPEPEGSTLGFLIFIGHASDGHITKGAYDLAYGGFNDAGVLAFGAKGGC